MRFSQRMGFKPVKTIFQLNNIDDDLRKRLWNIFLMYVGNMQFYPNDEKWDRCGFYKGFWKDFMNEPLNEIPRTRLGFDNELILQKISPFFLTDHWHVAYDAVEFIVQNEEEYIARVLSDQFNEALRLEVSAYRLVNNQIAKINTEEEIQTIEQAIEESENFKSVNIHLRHALEMLSDRKSPDYRNSIKESISAVEAYCKIVIGDEKATLGKALAVIEKKHKLHGSLKSAFNALYGYTSDAGGIRHAILDDDDDIQFEDAKFMMVSCSSFINYLSAKLSNNI